MTITRLIQRLQEEMRKHGDIEVVLDGNPQRRGPFPIEDIATFSGHTMVERQVWISANPVD